MANFVYIFYSNSRSSFPHTWHLYREGKEVLEFSKRGEAEREVNELRRKFPGKKFTRGPQGGGVYIYITPSNEPWLVLPKRDDIPGLPFRGACDVNAGVGKKKGESWKRAIMKEMGQETVVVSNGDILIPSYRGFRYANLIEKTAKEWSKRAGLELGTKRVKGKVLKLGEKVQIDWGGFEGRNREIVYGIVTQEPYSIEFVVPIEIYGDREIGNLKIIDVQGETSPIDFEGRDKDGKWIWFGRNRVAINLRTLEGIEYKWKNGKVVAEKKGVKDLYFTVKALGALLTLHQFYTGKSDEEIEALAKNLVGKGYEERYGVRYVVEKVKGNLSDYWTVKAIKVI